MEIRITPLGAIRQVRWAIIGECIMEVKVVFLEAVRLRG